MVDTNVQTPDEKGRQSKFLQRDLPVAYLMVRATMGAHMIAHGGVRLPILSQFAAETRKSFAGVNLLTLSACETALSGEKANGVEVESFGVLAQRQGAEAVMATLWPVADVSTPLLMREFYRLRETNPGMTKAEALRRAQVALLTGEIKPTNAGADNRGLMLGVEAADASFAHPFYWAPFILIGNWK